MTRNPDMPCSVCGNLMWRSQTTLPVGEAVCHPCRRKSPRYLEREALAARPKFKPELRTCRVCGVTFEAWRRTQVYCTPDCREARRGKSGSKTGRSSRGYGAAHQRERRKWKRLVEADQVDCCLCGYHIDPGTPWDLDHLPGTDEYRGAAHARCNRRDGAVRGNRQRGHRTPPPAQ